MDIQKAIEILNDIEADINYSKEDINKAMLKGIEALQQCQSKKPIDGIDCYLCPDCGLKLDKERDCCCPFCGQAIEWGDK